MGGQSMTLKFETLGVLSIDMERSHTIGETPAGGRRMAVFAGGQFEGPRLQGTILQGGTDVILTRRDGSFHPDARLTLQTGDGAMILVTYRGIRHGPEAVMQRIAQDLPVDPCEYYQRAVFTFETAAPRYDWLNRIFAIGTGRRVPKHMIYDVFELL